MDAILGHRPATMPPVIIDSVESNTGSVNMEVEGDEEPAVEEEKMTALKLHL